MPHAALLVVQEVKEKIPRETNCRFNAARGFVGGASIEIDNERFLTDSFNAARGFVGGASPSLAALVPLEEKCSFGKSPDF